MQGVFWGFFPSWFWWNQLNLVQNWTEQLAASTAFFPSLQLLSKKGVLMLLTGSCTTQSIKPTMHELMADLALCAQDLAIAGFFKAYAKGQAWRDHE